MTFEWSTISNSNKTSSEKKKEKRGAVLFFWLVRVILFIPPTALSYQPQQLDIYCIQWLSKRDSQSENAQQIYPSIIRRVQMLINEQKSEEMLASSHFHFLFQISMCA